MKCYRWLDVVAILEEGASNADQRPNAGVQRMPHCLPAAKVGHAPYQIQINSPVLNLK